MLYLKILKVICKSQEIKIYLTFFKDQKPIKSRKPQDSHVTLFTLFIFFFVLCKCLPLHSYLIEHKRNSKLRLLLQFTLYERWIDPQSNWGMIANIKLCLWGGTSPWRKQEVRVCSSSYLVYITGARRCNWHTDTNSNMFLVNSQALNICYWYCSESCLI